jgi:hypothetical protein
MAALPNDGWRRFVVAYITGKPGHGSLTRAFRAAGLDGKCKPESVKKIAWDIAHDPRTVDAIAEECAQHLRVPAGTPSAPEGSNFRRDVARCGSSRRGLLRRAIGRRGYVARQQPQSTSIE